MQVHKTGVEQVQHMWQDVRNYEHILPMVLLRLAVRIIITLITKQVNRR